MPRFAIFAIHFWVAKTLNVPARLPNFRVHKNCSVHAIGGRVLLHELLPPRALYVVFKFNAHRPKVPSIGKSAINFATLKDKSSILAEVDKFIHSQFLFHIFSFLFSISSLFNLLERLNLSFFWQFRVVTTAFARLSRERDRL